MNMITVVLELVISLVGVFGETHKTQSVKQDNTNIIIYISGFRDNDNATSNSISVIVKLYVLE